MRLVNQYLDRAAQLASLARSETDPEFKAQLLQQASAYRKLAAERAQKYALPLPDHTD